MEEKAISPDEVIYSSLINLALKENNKEKAKEFYDHISQENKPQMRSDVLDFHMVMLGCAKYSILINKPEEGSLKIDLGKGIHSRNGIAILSTEIPIFLKEQGIAFTENAGLLDIYK